MTIIKNKMDNHFTTEIQDMIDYFSKNYYRNKDTTSKIADLQSICQKLFSKDYAIDIINNVDGELSMTYPPKLIIPLYAFNESKENDLRVKLGLECQKLRDMMTKARLARCRTRFPVPIMLYDGKLICRSATLSGGAELYGRRGMQYFFSGKADEEETSEDEEQITLAASEWVLFDKVRSHDIKLLRLLDVQTICDLMVENKKVKFGMNVTSSEKVDKGRRYEKFRLISIPYPGCEFFKVYRDKGYSAKSLVYDWNQSFVDANLVLPIDPVTSSLNIDWSNYKNWDLITLTKNYLKVLLRYIVSGSNGVLIHCISGWDRTPLFVSLVRLSLWADGKMHSSLNASQILFLTLAYDWFLFGHNLVDRLSKGEEIMCFCFHMLGHIASSDFTMETLPTRDRRTNSGSDVDPSEFLLEYGQNAVIPTAVNPSNGELHNFPASTEMLIKPEEEEEEEDNYGPSFASTPNGNTSLLDLKAEREEEEEEDEEPKTLTNSTATDEECNGQYHSLNSFGTTPPVVICNNSDQQITIQSSSSNVTEDHYSASPSVLNNIVKNRNDSFSSLKSSKEDEDNFSSEHLGTSPITVPKNNGRHRSESTSSGSSWQVLSYSDSFGGSLRMVTPDEINKNVPSSEMTPRMEKLKEVQQLFYKAYCTGLAGRPKTESFFGIIWDKMSSVSRPF